MGLIAELRHRNVFRMASLHVLAARLGEDDAKVTGSGIYGRSFSSVVETRRHCYYW